MFKINGTGTTLENIHLAAKAEFLKKGFKDASLRNIVKSLGMTTGAFYGYYKSKEELFEAIVGEHYEYILNRFIKAQEEFSQLPAARQPEVMSEISGLCMYDILYYAYKHLEECKLIVIAWALIFEAIKGIKPKYGNILATTFPFIEDGCKSDKKRFVWLWGKIQCCPTVLCISQNNRPLSFWKIRPNRLSIPFPLIIAVFNFLVNFFTFV